MLLLPFYYSGDKFTCLLIKEKEKENENLIYLKSREGQTERQKA